MDSARIDVDGVDVVGDALKQTRDRSYARSNAVFYEILRTEEGSAERRQAIHVWNQVNAEMLRAAGALESHMEEHRLRRLFGRDAVVVTTTTARPTDEKKEKVD